MLLDHRSRSEVARMVSARTNGATPLVMASKNGHLSCVEYLVERCNADLEQVGSGECEEEDYREVAVDRRC